MNQFFNRVLLYDGSYMLHRALCVQNNWDMINSKGKRTGGIFGVLRSILKELKDYNYYPIVVFDGGLSERRLKIYPNYKKNEEKQLLKECKEEEKTEEQLLNEEFMREYTTQRVDLMTLLPLFGIPVIRFNNWEGDDLIYIISKMCRDCIVVSDDKDLIQLIYEGRATETSNRRCRIRRPLREEFLDTESLKKQGINVKEFVGCKAIIGDPSDNIPSSCFQVGEKTSLGLYKIYEHCMNNNISFPQNEEELTKLCKELDIAKRKAYLNFNENQFLTNLLLTNLTLVDEELTHEFIDTLTFDILTQCNINDEEGIYKLLDDYEIKTFDAKGLLNRITNVKDMLKIEDIEKAAPIREMNIPKKGLLGI